jgi:peptidoglycan/LPS O-acetylase OafA/YrhL
MLQLFLVRFHLRFPIWLALSLLFVAPMSVAAGAVYFRLIERPCMNPRWPQDLIARFRSGPGGRPPVDPALDLGAMKAVSKNGVGV